MGPYTATASFGAYRQIATEPAPAPKPNRPDEFWWIRMDQGMSLEPAQISFKGDAPASVSRIGDDSWGTPIEMFEVREYDLDGACTVSNRLELVERILQPGRVAEVASKLRDAFETREDGRNWSLVKEALDLLGQPVEW